MDGRGTHAELFFFFFFLYKFRHFKLVYSFVCVSVSAQWNHADSSSAVVITIYVMWPLVLSMARTTTSANDNDNECASCTLLFNCWTFIDIVWLMGERGKGTERLNSLSVSLVITWFFQFLLENGYEWAQTSQIIAISSLARAFLWHVHLRFDSAVLSFFTWMVMTLLRVCVCVCQSTSLLLCELPQSNLHWPPNSLSL